MNRAGPSKLLPSTESSSSTSDEELVTRVYDDWLAEMWDDYVAKELVAGRDAEEVVLGPGLGKEGGDAPTYLRHIFNST